MPPVPKAPRLADVAKAAGVSQGTVSNVFSRPELVRDEVREHVHAVARDLGYRGPDPRGRLLRAGKVNAIGVATAEPLSYFFEDPFARELMRGISDACDANGAGLSLVSALNTQQLAWNIRSAVVDGFVLLCIDSGDELVRLTKERQLPFVALALGQPDPTVRSLGTDDYRGAELAAGHLVALGHRRFGVIAIMFGEGRSGWASAEDADNALFAEARERYYGYRDVLEANGIAMPGVPVYETIHNQRAVADGLAAMFAAPQPPTALLCMSDRTALFAIDWLKAHGLRVPHDVSVVGFDGVPESEQSQPPLTTIAQPIHLMGERAVELILAGTTEPGHEVLDVKLVVRGSTAPPPADAG